MPGTDIKTETEQAPEEPSGLRAIWANTLEPVAPLPWYRRTSPKLMAAAVVTVALGAAVVAAAVTGAGAPAGHRIVLADRAGGWTRLADDGDIRALRAGYERRMTALRPYRDLAVARYASGGAPGDTLAVVGLSGSFPDPHRELEKYFGRMEGGDVMRETVTELQELPAGPLGGELVCAVLVYPSLSQSTCAWADGSTVGIVTDTAGRSEPQELAARTLDIRAAVEVRVQD
ncbi:hypothetical protein [Kitasatospora sp. NPDC090308]|uniref:hypothetical protein n=1 Tax=Kitasatospora sp. NPDC090308 TaxID=3364082 RepID=UPI0038179BE4